ncbi:hypothetical protein H5410_002757 [Solanum commersonii]|uniref:Transmembrane protein n=1 Tax=Solanum commersonii TaxID=4109 RepID=A0A9J6B324_SOLCO|nr:hypothetical protein H5410_002757 [Solanum commersonii]
MNWKRCGANMDLFCLCWPLGPQEILEEDIRVVLTMGSCEFWLWKDYCIDSRFKFVIPKLLERIAELEHNVESSRKVETSDNEINKHTKSTRSMERKIDMNKIDSKMDNFDVDLKKMKTIEKKWINKLAKSKKKEKQVWIVLLCVCILGLSLVFQRVLFLKGDSMKFP